MTAKSEHMKTGDVLVGNRPVLSRGTVIVGPSDDLRVGIRSGQSLLISFDAGHAEGDSVTSEATIQDDGQGIHIKLRDAGIKFGYAYNATAEQVDGSTLKIALYVDVVSGDKIYRQVTWTLTETSK